MKPLPKSFYLRDTAKVARGLLGKILVRKLGKRLLKAKIVETEAYYGKNDPASRAFTTPKMASQMWNEGGRTFIYIVHNNWLLNIVTGKKGIPSAVLIRAVEPLNNFEMLKDHRNGKDGFLLTNGPGKLTQALRISKEHHNVKIYDKKSGLTIADENKEHFQIVSSNRIGVKHDLKRKLRFYIKENRWISRKKLD